MFVFILIINHHIAEYKLPPDWTWSNLQADYECVKLSISSTEFISVANDFIAKMGGSARVLEVKIFFKLILIIHNSIFHIYFN